MTEDENEDDAPVFQTRDEAEAWLRKRNPELFAKFDAAFALLGMRAAGLKWVVAPSPYCDGCFFAVELPVCGVAQVHIHHQRYDTAEKLAHRLGEWLSKMIVLEQEALELVGRAPTKH